MATRIEREERPAHAGHRRLWGEALPRWGEHGLEYAPGSHWTSRAYGLLIDWSSDCGVALRAVVADDDVVRSWAEDDAVAAKRRACRDHLLRLALDDGLTQPSHAVLIAWARRRFDLLLRLSRVGVVPRPPAGCVPPEADGAPEQRHERFRRLTLRPVPEPHLEDPFS